MRVGSNNWTMERLQRLPEDGNRYEIIAGELFVTPAPALRHQYVVGELFAVLREYCQHVGLQVVMAPADVAVSLDTLVQPDVFVIPLDAAGRPPATYAEMGQPVLVIEVQSPSTTRVDHAEKLRLYRRMQIPEYWMVDAATRVLERWPLASEHAEVVRDLVRWQPIQQSAALEIDLAQLFRRVCGE